MHAGRACKRAGHSHRYANVYLCRAIFGRNWGTEQDTAVWPEAREAGEPIVRIPEQGWTSARGVAISGYLLGPWSSIEPGS